MSKYEVEIIERIKAQMKMKKFTQERLANCLGMKQYAVSRMLDGKPFPTLDQLNLIAVNLGCSIQYLLGLRQETYTELSSEAAKIAHAYSSSEEVIKELVKRVLNIE
ncbi:MAG: helix-turn-helix transcriptional regulator [Firmicutes bacterium]|nr:helix-turn-helix transcriptional regulator [Candidatus Colivicinus equi]